MGFMKFRVFEDLDCYRGNEFEDLKCSKSVPRSIIDATGSSKGFKVFLGVQGGFRAFRNFIEPPETP